MSTAANQIQSSGIYYSRGQNTYDNAPTQEVVRNFDEFEATVLADRSTKKGLTFICAPLAVGPHYQKPEKYPGDGPWRLANYVQERRFLAFDFDGFADPEAYRATLAHLAKYRGFGYTTASHDPLKPRARAVLAVTRSVRRDEAIMLCEILQAEMAEAVGADAITFDASVYRGEQPVFTADSTGRCNTFAEHLSGCMEAERFARPLIQLSGNCIELNLRETREVHALWHVLS